jgi:Fic family protein
LFDLIFLGGFEVERVYMLRGIKETAEQSRASVIKIKNLMSTTIHTIKNELPKIYSKELVDLIFQQPYCKIKFLEEAGVARRQTASFYLKELERIGILKNIKRGNEIYYIHVSLYKILTS